MIISKVIVSPMKYAALSILILCTTLIMLFAVNSYHYFFPPSVSNYIKIATEYNTKKLDPENAKRYLYKALELDPSNAEAIHELGFIAMNQEKYELALNYFNDLLKIQPYRGQAHYCKAHTLIELCRYQESIKILEVLYRKAPHDLNIKNSLITLYLQQENLSAVSEKCPYKESPWYTKAVNNKQILLRLNFYPTFRFGDIFMYIRYAKKLKDAGAHVTVETDPRVLPLLSELDYIDTLIPTGSPLPNNVIYYPVNQESFCVFTDNILTQPDNSPYLFARPSLLSEWQKKLSQFSTFKVGICWHSSIIIDYYRNKRACKRTAHLAALAPLAQIPNVQLFSLQKTTGEDELNNNNFSVYDFGPDIDTTNGRFMDTAAIIKNLDLVITTDTAIAHLAGALGVPTWVMLPKNAAWIWFTKRSDCPWYPTMKLFRQTQRGNWLSVIQEMKQELQSLLKIRTP